MYKDANLMMYDKPASVWTQSLPLGNGNLGACVFGGTTRETVYLNQDTLWSGYPRDTVREGSYEGFIKARQLVMSEKYLEAQDIIEKECSSVWSQEYIPLGNILIDFQKPLKTQGYRRTLDLSTAVCSINYFEDNIEFSREAFISYPKNVFVYHLSSSVKGKISFKLRFSSPVRHCVNSQSDYLVLEGLCPSDSLRNNIDFPERGELYSKEPEKSGISFTAAVTVKTKGGNYCFSGKSLEVLNADEATVYLACKTSFNGYDKHPQTQGKEHKNSCLSILKKAVTAPYEDIRKEHIHDYKCYYDRVQLDLGTDNKEDIPTDKRLKKHARGEEDRGLYQLLFNFGRYLIISASREGSQPANLQGIWNKELHAPWHSNYTVNINTQMNYWPVLLCNLPEFNLPLIEMIKELSEAGEKTAQAHYKARGFCVHHNVDLWRLTTPVSGSASWLFWPLGGGWLCDHIFKHYKYTNDKQFLMKVGYPIMKKSAMFLLDMLIEDKDGYLIFAPSTSPENLYKIDKHNTAVSETVTMTMSIIRQLFINCIEASETLDTDKEFCIELKDKLKRLLPFRTGSKGQLLEWYKEQPEHEPHHRHQSHLYGLHPSNLITPEDTPDLAEACRRTLELRGDIGTGWSLCWKINLWARLCDGDHALKMINMQLSPISERSIYNRGGGTYPNLFDAHPPFQIDGNFGYTSGICEMLMQSRNKKIFLLPALPSKWKNGEISGLLAEGNITVDIKWLDGKLKSYKLHGQAEDVSVFYKGQKIN